MGRFLIVLGIILIIAGFVLPFFGMQSFLEPILNIATDVSGREAELCKEGETLREVSGGSVYTPGMGYGRSVRYFCVNASGDEREVTDQFAQGMIGDVLGAITGASPFLLTMALSFCGFPVLILGILLSIRGRTRSARLVVNPLTGMPQSAGGFQSTGSSGDLSARLQQLDQAYQKNLLSREEYERLRDEIMNNPF